MRLETYHVLSSLRLQINLRLRQTRDPKLETRNSKLETRNHSNYCPLIYFAASVPAVWPVIEPRIRPEPLG